MYPAETLPPTDWPHPAGAAAQAVPERPVLSPLERSQPPHLLQRVEVDDELLGEAREQVLARLCTGRRVLHVGCAEWPFTHPQRSLHLKLQPHCAQLDGLDLHDLGFDMLRPHVRGRLFSTWEAAGGEYDLVLVPELLDRVDEPAALLTQINRLRAAHFAITVPDAYSAMRSHFDHVAEARTFFEATHPDRLHWFTPYTLTHMIRKFTDWRVQGLWFLQGGSLLLVASRPG